MSCKHVDAAGKRSTCSTLGRDANILQSFVLPQLPNQSIEKTVRNVLTP